MKVAVLPLVIGGHEPMLHPVCPKPTKIKFSTSDPLIFQKLQIPTFRPKMPYRECLCVGGVAGEGDGSEEPFMAIGKTGGSEEGCEAE